MFSGLKKLLKKPDEDVLFDGASTTVAEAKQAEDKSNFVSLVYFALRQKSKNVGVSASVSESVGKSEFVDFVKFFMKNLNEVQASDMYMFVTKRLQ